MPRVFDWRRFDSEPNLHDHEVPYLSNDPFRRYDAFQWPDGNPWRQLLHSVLDTPLPESGLDVDRRCLEAFDKFLAEIPAFIPNKIAQIFISHQRKDTDKGKRVACLADHHGLKFWLDVLDPNLARVNALPPHDPRRSVLIAAMIEIALLSCSHVIAVHTDDSLVSRWVPYELGRAKERQITSVKAAGWFASGQDASTCGDYVQLAVMTRNEPQVAQWLVSAGGVPNNVPVGKDCRKHKTKVLK
jgi:hypothetical protein